VGAPLDPYGIYGTRTQARLLASRRRRQTQNFLLVLMVLVAVAGVVAFSRWRREKTDVAALRFDTGVAVGIAPLLAPATKTDNAALLIANRDGVLLRYDKPEAMEDNGETGVAEKTVLLRDDFPLHTPLLEGETIFVPSESGVLTALLWRKKKVLWRKTFDDALCAQPIAFSIARPAPATAPATEATDPNAISPNVSVPVPVVPVPVVPVPATRRVVVAGSDAGLLIAVDVGSGQTLWRARMPAPIGNGLAAVEASGRARILVPLLGGTAMRGGVWCLDGATGKVLWRFPKDARAEAIQFAAPLPDLPGNRVYFGNDLGAVFSLNLTTGTYDAKKKSGWKSFVLPLNRNSENAVLLRAAPQLTDTPNKRNKLLVIGGGDGVARALSAGTGSTLWLYKSGAPIISVLRVQFSGEPSRVLIVNQSPQMVLLDAQTGKVVRRLSGRGETFAGAVVSERFIFAVTENGAVHRFALMK
jgi:outer membrane protein assembly factor BamB